MALPLAPYGHHQYLTNAGSAALASGTLETYAAGTSTPKATASDSAGAVDNPVVVTLNAYGRPQVNGAEVALYLKAGGYKFILKSAAGVELWSQDNIVGTPVSPTVLSKVATYSVTAADGTDVLVKADATAGAFTVSLYTAVGNTGNRVAVKKTDSSSSAVTVQATGSETIDGAATQTLASQYDAVMLESDGANWQIAPRFQAPADGANAILANRFFS